MQKLRILSPIHKATRQIHLYLEHEVSALGIANNEGHLLTYLLSYAPATIGELLRVFGFKRSTMTSMLDRLENARLIRRKPNADDRRSWLVELTAGGRKKAVEVRKIVDRFEKKVVGSVSKEELDSFQRVIDTVGEVTAVEVRSKS
jgi:DNA-binding MarR family transcriptional regulator